jgi:hypothetical protein
MYKLIALHIDTLLPDPRLREGVRDYAELQRRLHAVDVSRDGPFQHLYSRFWALNAARLNSSWRGSYFRLLEREKRSKQLDLQCIVQELRGLSPDGTLHVSFASKLVHMVDPSRPIYDSLVAAAFFFRPPATGSAERRLDVLLEFYRFLEAEYARATASALLGPAFAKFQAAFPESAAFTPLKVLDFLLWTCVRLLYSGAQRRGRLTYNLPEGSS